MAIALVCVRVYIACESAQIIGRAFSFAIITIIIYTDTESQEQRGTHRTDAVRRPVINALAVAAAVTAANAIKSETNSP